MRIALDARYLKADFTGIGVYSENLVTALARIESRHEFFIIQHESYKEDLELPPNFHIIRDRGRPVSMRTMLRLQAVLKRNNAHALHSLFPLVPLLWNGKLIATVHDLQPLLDPEFTGGRGQIKQFAYDAFYKLAYPSSLRKADYLISDSYATKELIIQYFPEVASRILVIHAGVPEEAFHEPTEEQVERVKEKYGLPDRFIFYLGSTRPNKNLAMMTDAFEEFMRRNPEQDDLHWVMVLNKDRFFDPLFKSIRERGLLRHIQIHEQVTEVEKRVFFSLATLLYFPTKYEGFGLPVLEAQAQGLPVLASNHAALPEVAGNAAIYCDPDNVDSIVSALEDFFRDADTPEYMRQAGMENLKRFTWDKAANEIMHMYDHLLT